jgi:hypothetical protein
MQFGGVRNPRRLKLPVNVAVLSEYNKNNLWFTHEELDYIILKNLIKFRVLFEVVYY